MKKFLLLALLSVSFISCGILGGGSVNMGHGGVMPGTIVTDVTYPSYNGSIGTVHRIEGKYNYEIVGPVETQTESSNILGMVAQGDNGYKSLMNKARALGGQGVINVVVDTKYNSYFFGIYTKVTNYLSGLAVRYYPANQNTAMPVMNFQPQTKVLPALPPIQPQTVKPDKSKSYFVMVNGVKYGPVNYQQIKDLERMSYVKGDSAIYETETNKEFKVSDFE